MITRSQTGHYNYRDKNDNDAASDHGLKIARRQRTIMTSGRVRCDGSPLFLKQSYSIGYTFTISLKIAVKSSDVKQRIDDIVLNYIKNDHALSVAAGEISYRLPFDQSDKFSFLFEELDRIEEDENIGISSYGISVTTLEEVFIKIGNYEEQELDAETADANEDIASQEMSPGNYNDMQKMYKLVTSGMNGMNGMNGHNSNEASQNGANADGVVCLIYLKLMVQMVLIVMLVMVTVTIHIKDEPIALTDNAYENPFNQPQFKL